MKKTLLVAVLACSALVSSAQVVSDTLTYTRGTLGVQSVFPETSILRLPVQILWVYPFPQDIGFHLLG